MEIRVFRPADAPALSALFHAAVHGIAARDYDARQCAAWSPAPADPARFLARAADGRQVLLAVDGTDAPLAYGDMERDGHLDHLYCRPDAAGTGVTVALYAALEQVALDWQLGTIFLEASEPARRFFLRRGFRVEARRDFTIGDVPIHNYAMTKAL